MSDDATLSKQSDELLKGHFGSDAGFYADTIPDHLLPKLIYASPELTESTPAPIIEDAQYMAWREFRTAEVAVERTLSSKDLLIWIYYKDSLKYSVTAKRIGCDYRKVRSVVQHVEFAIKVRTRQYMGWWNIWLREVHRY